MKLRIPLALFALPLVAAGAQPPGSVPPSDMVRASAQPTYADLADLALPAPVVAHVRMRRAIPLKPEESPGLAPGFTRFYIESEILALIRGAPGMPTEIRYLIDLPNDPNGRRARPERRGEWLIFARTVPGRPDELQLIAPDGRLPYAPATADRVRANLREGLASDAPPAITGIGRAFHVPGVLPGASETQIFLLTAANQPISLTVRRQPQLQPQWFVSLSEFVDSGATQPAPDSLLWYRLACFLPPELPAASFSEAPQHAEAIRADYRLIRQGLGPCPRLRTAR